MISARKAKQLDATTMFTYSHANAPLSQSERAYYLSYFIIEGHLVQLDGFDTYKTKKTKHTEKIEKGSTQQNEYRNVVTVKNK